MIKKITPKINAIELKLTMRIELSEIRSLLI